MEQAIHFNHSTPIQLRFTDIDMMAHVTNSVYFVYCDIARMEYFTTVLNEKIEQSEESLVIASLQIDFINPIFFHEKIEIQTKVIKIGNKSIQTLQHIINAETKTVKATVKSILSGYNYEARHAISIPDKWKTKIENFETVVEYKQKA